MCYFISNFEKALWAIALAITVPSIMFSVLSWYWFGIFWVYSVAIRLFVEIRRMHKMSDAESNKILIGAMDEASNRNR